MASILYSCVATISVGSLLSYQFLLISTNVTSYEWRCARRVGYYLDKFGQPTKENMYDQGLIKNWIAFLKGYR